MAFMSNKVTTFVLSVFFILLYSSGFVAIKLGFPFASPLTLLTYRSLILIAIFLVFTWLFKAPWPKNWREVGHIAVSGFFVTALFSISTWSSIAMGVPPATSALIIGLQPLMVSLISYFLFKNSISLKEWLGLLVGFIGVGLVVGGHVSFDKAYLFGVFLSFIGLLSLTVGGIYQKHFCAHMNVFSGGVIQAVTAVIISLILSTWIGPIHAEWTNQFIFSLLWMCIFVSFGAISIFYFLLKKGESHKVASLFYLIPVTTAMISYLVFYSKLDPIQWCGMIIATLGVGLVNFKFR